MAPYKSIHGPGPGSEQGYKWRKCRCSECKEAHRISVRQQRDKRKKWLKEIDGRMVCTNPKVTHGIVSTYINWYCRCLKCSRAQSNYRSQYWR